MQPTEVHRKKVPCRDNDWIIVYSDMTYRYKEAHNDGWENSDFEFRGDELFVRHRHRDSTIPREDEEWIHVKRKDRDSVMIFINCIKEAIDIMNFNNAIEEHCSE